MPKLHFWQKAGLFVMAFHLVSQALIPLRHFAMPDYASWSENGHNFAWHMKLRGKSGKASFTVRDPDTGKTQVIHPEYYLTNRQAGEMATAPDLILQFAHFLRDRYTRPGEKPVEVYAETKINLNKRRSQRLVDPAVNLSEIKPSLWSEDWIFPLRQPVWNARRKKNRFGPALKLDEVAMRAIHKFDKKSTVVVGER